MLFELFDWAIIKSPVFVLDDAVSFNIAIGPSCADCFIFKSQNTTALELLIKELAFVSSMIFENHESLCFVTFLEPPSDIISIVVLNLSFTL